MQRVKRLIISKTHIKSKIMNLDEVLYDSNKTALEQYIVILQVQLDTMQKNNPVTQTIQACQDLAIEVNRLYQTINN